MDEVAEYLAHSAVFDPLSPEEEKAMMHKMDWILQPMLFMTANLGAVDKVSLSTAATYGLKDDLHLVRQQFSWAGSILPLGAIVGMWPSTYLVHKLPSAKYLSACSLGWSAIALLMPVAGNWSGLMALRFFMGCLEAIIVPSISLIIAGFYKKAEQPLAMPWCLRLQHIPSTAALSIWQYLFLVNGSISVLSSILVLIFLQDSPMNAFFLSDRQKYHVAVIDPKTWVLFFFNIAINIPNGGLQTFSSIIINNLSFTPQTTSLLNMPTDVVFTLSTFCCFWVAAKWSNRRCLVAMLACCIPIIGAIMVYSLPRTNVGGQMVGIYLLYTYFGPYVVGISMAQANTAGNTKKAVQYSILYIGYAVGNIIGPQTFRANQAPAYTGGFIAMLASYCVCVLLMAVYWAISFTFNRRRIDGVDPGEEQVHEDLVDAFADPTDFQQKTFKYTT
ncbi:major facilitator superfamily domain-containing protein [Ilyonectria destructans]|nr:major facilitator superfamily domain-containing protein [Ilyonectria destructans]